MSWSEPGRARLRACIAILCMAGIVACGFRMQGSERFPAKLSPVHIQAADSYSPFYRALRDRLEEGGLELVDSPATAAAVIRIELDDTGQDVLTVSSRNVPIEYDVYYTVRYSVWVDGVEALPARELTLRQDYTYDTTAVLGKRREETAIRRSIAASLVRQVSQQLARL